MTKTLRRQLARQLAGLRRQRARTLAGDLLPWGVPWCAGPGGPYHQHPFCDGCATVAWCSDRAADLAPEIARLQARLSPTEQGALW